MQKRFTATQAKAIREPGRYCAGETLYLQVKQNPNTGTLSKSWVQRLVVNGKRHDIGLGGFRFVSLQDARAMAFANQRMARTESGDPLEERRKEKTPTFLEASQKTFESLKPRWRNKTTARNWKQSLEKHAYPVIGAMPIDRIGREEILKILVPIWSKRPEVARRVKQRIHATLQWGMAHGFLENNSADLVKGTLPVMPKVRSHFRALNYNRDSRGTQNY